jgi:hypothetical protein
MKVINIDDFSLYVKEAMEIFDSEVTYYRSQRQVVIKVIHGYGSTGVGGSIRKAVISRLANMKKSKLIYDYIPGDSFQHFKGKSEIITKFKKYLKDDNDYGKDNEGITYIILKNTD